MKLNMTQIWSIKDQTEVIEMLKPYMIDEYEMSLSSTGVPMAGNPIIESSAAASYSEPPMNPSIKVFFYCLYFVVFMIGMIGNVLVCYVVLRNKHMQTVTNIFIMNLALSDILLCVLGIPFTVLYLITLKNWVRTNLSLTVSFSISIHP